MPRNRLAAALAASLALTAVTVPAKADALPSAKSAKVEAGAHSGDVIVELAERADLSAARSRPTHGERVAYGQKRLADVAERSQHGLRDLLIKRKAKFRQLWIVNAVQVSGADAGLVTELAARPEVKSVRRVRTFTVPKPTPAKAVTAAAGAVEWNVSRIGADRVWADYGTRGEGIVVASIDTGVQFDHPALVEHYRGNLGEGVFQHRYNWFDPYGQCGLDVGPCDINGHGTHTMGTMVGDDGDANHTGVAPGARWIAARGCDAGGGCNTLGLLLAAQWLVAPLDEAYANPRPDLAPHVINNSWGSAISDPFFADAVRNWIAVGIMPVFAAGNDGPDCDAVGSPADYVDSYSVAAYDSEDAIAPFSSRGSANGETKPDIAAPGAAIRSSLNGSRYAVYDGTSMAAPHVAGAVALLWSAAPSLIGDVAATRRLLDDTAADVSDTTCGGSADDNAVWGEGRMDVYAAVTRAPRGTTGTLTGVVRSAGAPAGGVRVHLAGGNRIDRVAHTDGAGRYTVALPSGSYKMDVSGFGYLPANPPALTITAGQTTTVDATVTGLARHAVSGMVRDAGGVPAPGISLRLLGTPLAPVSTGADGRYRIDGVPAGAYTMSFGAGRCLAAGSRLLTVDRDETVDLDPPARSDSAGYQCQRSTAPYVGGTTVLPLTGDDESTAVTLPFAMPYYGSRYTTAWVATNGFLTFDRQLDNAINREIPNSSLPNAALFPLWDDLVVDAAASVRTATLGTAPRRRFVVEWRNVAFYEGADRATFSLELQEQGGVVFHYGDLTGPLARGAAASVGIEDRTGGIGLEYSRDAEALTAQTAVAFHASGALRGTVTRPDGNPAGGARVQATRGDAAPVTVTAAADGTYWMALPLGTYRVDVSLITYGTHRATVVLDTDGATVDHNVLLSANERTVSGVVRDDLGNPVEGARVWLTQLGRGVEMTAHTGQDGGFQFAKVPEWDSSTILYADVDGCLRDGRTSIDEIIGQDVTADVIVYAPTSVVDGADSFGYQCRVGTAQPVTAATPLAVTAAWNAPPTPVTLPFAFPFYGRSYSTVYAAGYGYISFEPATGQSTSNDCLPGFDIDDPIAALYPYWDTLVLDASSRVVTGTSGTAPNRRFTISWQNVLLSDRVSRATFDAVLAEDGGITFEYPTLPDLPTARGKAVTVGIEGPPGTDSMEYLCRDDMLRPGGALGYLPPATASGTITEEGRTTPIAGATVKLVRNDRAEATVVTDAAGRYTARAPLGTYTVAVTQDNYFPNSADGVILGQPGSTVRRDLALVPRR